MVIPKVLRITFLLPTILFIAKSDYAQNLVPNSSFEYNTACPDTYSVVCPSFHDEVTKCIYWKSATCGSPDYYHGCAPSNGPGVPKSDYSSSSNYHNYQPASSGMAYLGLYTKIGVPNVREYVTAPLSDTLINGQFYYVEFFINLKNRVISGPLSGTDRIGVLLSQNLPDTSGVGYHVISIQPSVERAAGMIMNDTVNWEKVSGWYLANGGERYITIGNFADDQNTLGDLGYYYIDDVCISPVRHEFIIGECNVTTSIPTLKKQEFTIYPNPATNQLSIIVPENEHFEQLKIFDISGRICFKDSITDKHLTLDTKNLTNGIYYISFSNANGQIVIKKFAISR